MKSRVTFNTVIKVTRMASGPICSWPLTSDVSHATILKRDIFWWMAIIHAAVVTSFIFYDIFRSFSHDIEHAITISAELTASLMVLSTMVLCKVEATRLQSLLRELQSFVNQANEEELNMIQTYLDKCLYFHTVIFIATMCGPIVFIIGGFATEQLLPIDAQYPYLIESTWVLAVTLLSQMIMIVQTASTVIIDFLFIILMWYTGARIEILAMQLRRATTRKDFKRCIREHQYLLEYMAQLKISVRLIVSAAMILTLTSIVTGGLILMRRPPMFVVMKFSIFELVAVMRLFVFSWPADNLMDKSERLAVAVFDCKWIGQSPGMMQDLMFIMHKAQIPLVIDLPGITPALTLEFYTSIMKLTFSYLTTLHAMVDN